MYFLIFYIQQLLSQETFTLKERWTLRLLHLCCPAPSASDLEGDNPCQSITLHSQSHQVMPAGLISALDDSKGENEGKPFRRAHFTKLKNLLMAPSLWWVPCDLCTLEMMDTGDLKVAGYFRLYCFVPISLKLDNLVLGKSRIAVSGVNK